jgi:hypothetical protein
MRFARRLLVALLCPVLLCALDYRAGVSRLEISPGRWARALAIEDTRNGRVVFAAADGTALSWQVAELVAARVLKEYDLDRARLVLNVSGGDSAPIGEEGMKLADALVTVSGAALGALRPARISFARGGAENSGVAVLSVTGLDGSARALLYDRACGKAAPAGAFELSEAHGTPCSRAAPGECTARCAPCFKSPERNRRCRRLRTARRLRACPTRCRRSASEMPLL